MNRKRIYILGILVAIGVVFLVTVKYKYIDSSYLYNEIERDSLKKVDSINKEKAPKTNEDFNIENIKSNVDFNNNGIDDYEDILQGARKDAINHPTYDPSYVQGGYPKEDRGVCTDVVWRAFKNAGYDLKSMVDLDIERNLRDYPRVEGKPDKNIDFRRVPNLDAFFKKYGESLTLNPTDIDKWQKGDIVVYGTKHIGIVSDFRNDSGRSFLIHNYGQSNREEDNLLWGKITGHYRFNAEKIPRDVLVEFKQ